MNRVLKACSILCSSSSKIPSLFRPNGRSCILQGHVKVLSNRNPISGFPTYCTKGIRPMTEESANLLIPKVPGWDLVNDGGVLKLNRSLKVKSVTKGLDLYRVIADIAEAEGHHPPDFHLVGWLVGWNNVKIEIWTHSVSGLTENDFILASKINALDIQHLLRRKVSLVDLLWKRNLMNRFY